MRALIISAVAALALASPARAAEPLPKEFVDKMSYDCQQRYQWLFMRVNGLQEWEAELRAGRPLRTEKGEQLYGAAASRWLVDAMNAAAADTVTFKRECVLPVKERR